MFGSNQVFNRGMCVATKERLEAGKLNQERDTEIVLIIARSRRRPENGAARGNTSDRHTRVEVNRVTGTNAITSTPTDAMCSF
jgi:hypothetical protein